MQPAAQPPDYAQRAAQRIAQIVATMPPARAREVLDFAEFLVTRGDDPDAASELEEDKFDATLGAMPDALTQMFIHEAAQANVSGAAQPLFDERGTLAR